MAANVTPIFPSVVNNGRVTIVNADGTTAKSLYSAGANGSRVDQIVCTSDDTGAQTVQLIINDGTNDNVVGEIAIPAGAGTNGSTKAVKVINSTDLPWLSDSGSIFIKTGYSIKVKSKAAVTAAKTLTFVAFAGDY